jgi:hypothetical protein
MSQQNFSIMLPLLGQTAEIPVFKRNETMNRFLATVLVTGLAAAAVAGAARAQSSPNDPLGINATEDTSIARQRGALQGGVNSSLGVLPDSYRNEDTVSGWSFENGDIIFHKK